MRRRSLTEELEDLENSLGEESFADYMKFRNQLGGTSEKIYYLRLRSKALKRNYLESRGIITSSRESSRDIQAAVRSRDVVLGMTKGQVESSWGRPMRVDVAGNPRYENERWSFYDAGKVKYIYFEGGVVHGWSEEQSSF